MNISAMFTVLTDRKTLVGEHSSMQFDGPECDTFDVQSTRTNKVASFTKMADKHDEEGDLLYTLYRPTRPTLNTSPSLAGWMVQVFND